MIFVERALQHRALGEMPIELQIYNCPGCGAIYLYFHFFFYTKIIYLLNHDKDCCVENLIKILKQVASINKKLELIMKEGRRIQG